VVENERMGREHLCGEAMAMGVDLWKKSERGVVEVDVQCCYCLLSAGCTEFCYSNLMLGVTLLISDY
jgi:hypothetical protein